MPEIDFFLLCFISDFTRIVEKNNIFYLIMSSTITETATPVVAVADNQASNLPSLPRAEDDATYQSIARGNRAGTLKLRGIPVHKDVYAQRQWMKEHMAAAFRFFGKQGYGEGASGHISMRGTSISIAIRNVWSMLVINAC